MRRVISSFALLALLIAMPLSALAADVKIGLVNTQDVLLKSKTGSRAFEQLKAKVEPREKQINAKGQELKQLEQDLVKQRGLVSQEALQGKLADFNAKLSAFQEELQKFQKESQQEEKAALEPLRKRLLDVVAAYGSKNGFTLIIDASMALFATGGSDITEAVKAEFDKGK